MSYKYTCDRLGIVCDGFGIYVMDGYGNLVQVDWYLYDGYFCCEWY